MEVLQRSAQSLVVPSPSSARATPRGAQSLAADLFSAETPLGFKRQLFEARAEDAWEFPVEKSYAEGRRRLRQARFEDAVVFLEACWYKCNRLTEPPPGSYYLIRYPPPVPATPEDPDGVPETSSESGAPAASPPPKAASPPPKAAEEPVPVEPPVFASVADGVGSSDESEDSSSSASATGDAPSASKSSATEAVVHIEGEVEAQEDFELRLRRTAGRTPPPYAAPTQQGVRHQWELPPRRKAFEHEKRLPLQLCAAYGKVGMWDQVDRTVRHTLDNWKAIDVKDSRGSPIFRRPKDEERWVQLMIQRGVACASLGVEEFPRARGAFQMVQRVQPKNRHAKRGLDCLRFLERQLCNAGPASRDACSTALSALAAAVTPDLTRMRRTTMAHRFAQETPEYHSPVDFRSSVMSCHTPA